jgi:hypothetical protein
MPSFVTGAFATFMGFLAFFRTFFVAMVVSFMFLDLLYYFRII